MQLFVKSMLLLLAGLVFFAVAGVVATWAPDKTVAQLRARWAPPPSQFVIIDGLQVHLRDEGPRDDPLPVVLIHGTSDSLHTWDGWTDLLVPRHRVIRFDLPGFGLTGPNQDNDYSSAYYVKFVAAVLDHLGVRHCVLVGNSLGGQVAWEAALNMPQRVLRLVLLDAGGYPLQSTSLPLAFSLARSHVARWILQYVLPRGLVQASLRNVYGDPSKVTPELVDRYYDMALRSGNRRALGYRIDAGLGGDVARLRTLALPVLVIWGARDYLIPLQFGQRFARDIAGAQLVVFEDLGHLPQQEDPLRTVTEFQKFLGSRPPN
jgi:pimeloyl-ACP methyl ester carboxylesterase